MKKSTKPSSPATATTTKSREPRAPRVLDTEKLAQIAGGDMGVRDHSI